MGFTLTRRYKGEQTDEALTSDIIEIVLDWENLKSISKEYENTIEDYNTGIFSQDIYLVMTMSCVNEAREILTEAYRNLFLVQEAQDELFYEKERVVRTIEGFIDSAVIALAKMLTTTCGDGIPVVKQENKCGTNTIYGEAKTTCKESKRTY
jgi:hypothetical protein